MNVLNQRYVIPFIH